MKQIAFLWLVVSISFTAAGQLFTVVKVFGKVESPALSRILQSGDKISGKDQLKFGSADAYVIITSAKTGNKKISGVPDASPREFMQLMESFIKPVKIATASRGIAGTYLEHMVDLLYGDTLLILGDGQIAVDQSQLSLKSPAAVMALYHTSKGKVRQKISTANGYCLSQKCLFNGPTPLPPPKIAVFHFLDERDDFPENLFGAFVPMYVNEAELIKEVNAVVAFAKSEKKEALLKKQTTLLAEIKVFMAEIYWRSPDENLVTWLSQNGVMLDK